MMLFSKGILEGGIRLFFKDILEEGSGFI